MKKNGRPKRYWTFEEIQLLGTMSDEKISRILNIPSSSTVTYQRHRLNIQSYASKKDVYRTWTKKEISLLGTMSDEKVARKIGISRLNVYKKRHDLNINAWKK